MVFNSSLHVSYRDHDKVFVDKADNRSDAKGAGLPVSNEVSKLLCCIYKTRQRKVGNECV